MKTLNNFKMKISMKINKQNKVISSEDMKNR